GATNIAGYMGSTWQGYPGGLTAWDGWYTVTIVLYPNPSSGGNYMLQLTIGGLVMPGGNMSTTGAVSHTASAQCGAGSQIYWNMYKYPDTPSLTGTSLYFALGYHPTG